MIKPHWIRVDAIKLIELNQQLDYLHTTGDAEWDELALCFWIKKGSKTHVMLALQFGDIFD